MVRIFPGRIPPKSWVWFFPHNLSFMNHIDYISTKCTKRLNLLKAVASSHWRAKTVNLIPLINSLISGVIDYACPVYSVVANSSFKRLDVVYNGALRFATGLLKCTPIYKLYWETNQEPLCFRRRYLTSSFYIRCFSATNFDRPCASILPDGFVWPTDHAEVTPCMLIKSYWPCGIIKIIAR